jgi:hypothetical protein
MSSPLDSHCQTALLTLGQTSLLASFDLPVLVYIALQGLKVLVVKKRYVCSVFKYLCHLILLKKLFLILIDVYTASEFLYTNGTLQRVTIIELPTPLQPF